MRRHTQIIDFSGCKSIDVQSATKLRKQSRMLQKNRDKRHCYESTSIKQILLEKNSSTIQEKARTKTQKDHNFMHPKVEVCQTYAISIRQYPRPIWG
jgi:hypothetical protein